MEIDRIKQEISEVKKMTLNGVCQKVIEDAEKRAVEIATREFESIYGNAGPRVKDIVIRALELLELWFGKD